MALTPRTTSRLINRMGKTVSFYDRSADLTHNGIKISPPEAYKDFFIDGDLIKYGDMKTTFSPVNITYIPDLSDEVTIDAVTWMIESIDKIWFADALLEYEIHLRKSGNTTLTPSTLWTKIDKKMVPASYRIIEEKGINVIFHAASDYTRKVVTQPEFDSRMMTGDLIETGDIRIHLPAKDLPFQPKAGMHATYEGAKWLIAGEFPIYSGEQVCIYELLLRR